MISLHEAAFTASLRHLRGLLAATSTESATERATNTKFWRSLRDLRAAAFEFEFLAKFYRKAHPADREDYLQMIALVKPLEDRLGALEDIDDMIPYCERYGVDRQTQEIFSEQRYVDLKNFRQWQKSCGWLDGRALTKLGKKVKALHWLEGEDLRAFARQQMSSSLTKLQNNIEKGRYSPKDGKYQLREVEPKVHQLRRDIRKQAQYMIYTGGLFQLADTPTLPAIYAPLLVSPFASDRYAHLPKAQIAAPLVIPRGLFLALNSYISDLGGAKDWALRLRRLQKAGLKGKIDFDQLDVTLGGWRQSPKAFNPLALGLIEELQRTRPFALMQRSIADSR